MNLSEQVLELHSKKPLVECIETIKKQNEKKITEELSMDKITASAIYMTSKNGKLTNKKINDWLVKGFIIKGKLEDDPDYLDIVNNPRGIAVNPKKLADMLEDWNHHTITAMIRLLSEGKAKNAEWLILIADEHEKQGSMPRWLSNLRFLANEDKFMERMLADMEKTAMGTSSKFSSEINVKNGGETPSKYWSILKKHPDKKLSARIEAMKDLEEIKPWFLSVSYSSSDKEARKKISGAYYDLTRKLNKEFKDDNVKVVVNGPWDDVKETVFL